MLAVGGSMAANGATKITQEKVPLTSTEFSEQSGGAITWADTQTDIAYTNGDDFSLAFWFKITTDQTGTMMKDYEIVQWGKNQSGGFQVTVNDESGDDEHIMIRMFQGTGTSLQSYDDTTNLAHDTWYHCAIVFDYSEQTLVFYIDGEQSSSHSSVQRPTTTDALQKICGGFAMGDSGFDGWLNNLVMWDNVALTADEIAQVYNGGNSCDVTKIRESELLFCFPLDSRDVVATVNDYGPHSATAAGQSNLSNGDFAKTETSKNTIISLG